MNASPTISYDVYENQLVREFHDQARRRLNRLSQVARLVKSFAERSGPQLRRLDRRLRLARDSAAFLDPISRLERRPDHVTQVLLRRPDYRAALEGYLRLQTRTRLKISDPLMASPMRDVPKLYELWCRFCLVAEVLLVAANNGWEVDQQEILALDSAEPFVSVRETGRLLTMRKGGKSAMLEAHPTYTQTRGTVRSLSFDQIPDLVLTVRTAEGDPQLHVFDPKYKLGSTVASGERPTKDDIDKMHTYRDAIRDESGTRVVRSASVLYPGPDWAFGDRISAFHFAPGQPSPEQTTGVTEVLNDVLL